MPSATRATSVMSADASAYCSSSGGAGMHAARTRSAAVGGRTGRWPLPPPPPPITPPVLLLLEIWPMLLLMLRRGVRRRGLVGWEEAGALPSPSSLPQLMLVWSP